MEVRRRLSEEAYTVLKEELGGSHSTPRELLPGILVWVKEGEDV